MTKTPSETFKNVDFEKLLEESADFGSYHYCRTETKVKCDLHMHVHSLVLENYRPTNGIIDVDDNWGILLYWSLGGSLRKCLCGYWCVKAAFESIGEGPEFSLEHRDIEFDCNYFDDGTHNYWWAYLPGNRARIDGKPCGDPYIISTIVGYKTKCGKRGGITGTCRLDDVVFVDAEH